MKAHWQSVFGAACRFLIARRHALGKKLDTDTFITMRRFVAFALLAFPIK